VVLEGLLKEFLLFFFRMIFFQKKSVKIINHQSENRMTNYKDLSIIPLIFSALFFVATILMIVFGAVLYETDSPFLSYTNSNCTLVRISDLYLCGRYYSNCYNGYYLVDGNGNVIEEPLVDPKPGQMIINGTYSCITDGSSISLSPGSSNDVNEAVGTGITLMAVGCSFFIVSIMLFVISSKMLTG
jgi:hypothetical protein